MNLKESKTFADWLIYKILIVTFLAAMISLGISHYATPYDSTDAPGKRSGMRLYRDAETGCEYLSAKSGLTPRLDVDNKHVGCHKTGKEYEAN